MSSLQTVQGGVEGWRKVERISGSVGAVDCTGVTGDGDGGGGGAHQDIAAWRTWSLGREGENGVLPLAGAKWSLPAPVSSGSERSEKWLRRCDDIELPTVDGALPWLPRTESIGQS